MYDVQISRKPVKYFPAEIKENEKAYAAIRYFLSKRKGNFLQRGMRFMRKMQSKYLAKK
jgi:hypothetical protein